MSDSEHSKSSSSSSSSESESSSSSEEEVNHKRRVKSSVSVKKGKDSTSTSPKAKNDTKNDSEDADKPVRSSVSVRKGKETTSASPKVKSEPEEGALSGEDGEAPKSAENGWQGSPARKGRDSDERRGRDSAERRERRDERHRDRHRDDRRDRDRQRRDRDYDRRRERDRRDERSDMRRDRRDDRDDRPDRKRRREEQSGEGDQEKEDKEDNMENFLAAKRAKAKDDTLLTRTGGAYIPPAKLRLMQQQITDKASAEFQRIAWEALKKSINGLVNKVNVSNIISIVKELFQENIVRGRGVMARSIIQAQAASPTFTHVYAALVAIVNTKFPQNGELILKRLILNFKKGFRRNDKNMCMASVKFIAHLVNQQVAHEILALEILTLLLENPTDDSVEVAIAFLKESGQKLTEVSPRGMHAIFERLRNILHEAEIDKRVQYMIEVIFATRKDGFKEHPAVVEDLDLVEEEDQFTHMLTLEDAVNSEDMLNIFKFDQEYEANEEKYKALKREILDEGSSDEEGGGSGSESGSGSDSDSDDEAGEGEEGEKMTIIDETETNMVALRRTIYLTIQSSLDFEECAHKLLKVELKPGQEGELCAMILDCCAQQRTYEKFFGLLAQRFCMIEKKYLEPFQALFGEQYTLCHRLETNKLRNVAKFFAHLLHSDAMSWEVLQIIKLNEDDTTSSSRIFIKILFQELCEYMGLPKLNARLKDETLQIYFEGLFPRDNPKNTRFAINFFTSIGLGGLTDELRAHLKNKAKTMMQQQQQQQQEEAEAESSSSSDSSSSSSDSSSESSSSDSDSDEEDKDPRRRKKGKENKSPAKVKVRERSRDNDHADRGYVVSHEKVRGKRDKHNEKPSDDEQDRNAKRRKRNDLDNSYDLEDSHSRSNKAKRDDILYEESSRHKGTNDRHERHDSRKSDKRLREERDDLDLEDRRGRERNRDNYDRKRDREINDRDSYYESRSREGTKERRKR